MPPPLPWAPRPHPGESLSGWVARVASRYDVTADRLCRHVLDEQGLELGRIERLDHRADPELVDALAAAASLAPARLRAMRTAGDDGSASCWFRMETAWCPDCVRGDLTQGPETHERALWRLGCSVICPDHGVPLQNTCGRCWDRPRCRFRPAEGWLGLACDACGDLPYRPDQLAGSQEFGGLGAFNVQITPDVHTLVGELQRDLQAALLGAAPTGSWGAVRSGPLLLRVVRDFAFSIVLAKAIRVEQRTELVMDNGRIPYITVLHEPITPAALSPNAAFGVFAIAGAVLASMVSNGDAGHVWRQDGGLRPINAQSFMERLDDQPRRWLCASAGRWNHPIGAAIGAASTHTSSTVPTT